MQKTVKFLKHYPKRDWDTDNFVCGFRFSVIDTHLIGTPYETETTHKLKVILSDRLMINWGLWEAGGDGTSDDMLKVAYQSAEEYISTLITSGIILKDELSPLERITENSPTSCPYKIANITYPTKDTFVVDFDKHSSILVDTIKSNNTESKALRVFLCHASADKPAVRALYKRLVADDVDTWLDQEKLLPGQNWRVEIPKAVRNSDVVIVCLSKNSVNKEGYIQKEIKIALDVADEKPEGVIFIIPARLDECQVPDRLSIYQWVDLFSEQGYTKLIKALSLRIETMAIDFQNLPPAVPIVSLSRGPSQESSKGPMLSVKGPLLFGRSGELAGQHISIPSDGLKIGRAHDCQIHLQESSVSRYHAVLVKARQGVYLRDENSAVGTYLNGQRISPGIPMPLNDGDVIQTGYYQVFEIRMK